MPEKRIIIDQSLTKKGFERSNQSSHLHYKLIIDGKITDIRTKMSMGSNYKTIGDNLLSKMSKQLKMKSVADFRRYIECTYSEESYIGFLKKEGIL
jgi:hypothetical protein